METLKCKCCGANLQTDIYGKVLPCEYCGSTHVENKQNTTENQKTTATTVVNKKAENYVEFEEDITISKKAPPEKPQLSLLLFLILLMFNFFPGFIYLAIVSYRTKMWEEKYRKDKDKINNNNNLKT